MEPDVVLVGDSLVANLQSTDLWEKWFAPMHSLNFGIGGDQTQHVLWRLRNGELEYIKPKVGLKYKRNTVLNLEGFLNINYFLYVCVKICMSSFIIARSLKGNIVNYLYLKFEIFVTP